MWQELIVGVIVIAAIVFLIRRWLPFFKKSPACETGCGGCGYSANENCKTSPHK